MNCIVCASNLKFKCFSYNDNKWETKKDDVKRERETVKGKVHYISVPFVLLLEHGGSFFNGYCKL